MIRTGFTFENPITRSRWLVVESDAETGGMGWTWEIRCAPSADIDILEHLHLTWTETFEIILGTAYYKLNGIQKTAATEEIILMPPRQTHIHPWNAGDTELVYRQTTRFERPNPQAVKDVIGVFATLFGLAGEGKVGKNGLPRNVLQFAASARTLARYDSYDARFPIFMQNFLSATLGRFAEAVGYEGVYPQYLIGH